MGGRLASDGMALSSAWPNADTEQTDHSQDCEVALGRTAATNSAQAPAGWTTVRDRARGDRDETIHHAMDVLNLVFAGVWGPEDRRTGRLRHLSSLTRRRRGRVSTRDRPSPYPRSGAPLDFGWSKSPRISTRQPLSRILVCQPNLAPSSPRRLRIIEASTVDMDVVIGRRPTSSLWPQRVGHGVRQGA